MKARFGIHQNIDNIYGLWKGSTETVCRNGERGIGNEAGRTEKLRSGCSTRNLKKNYKETEIWKGGNCKLQGGMTKHQMARWLKTAFSNKVNFAYLDVNNFKEVIWRRQISIDWGQNTKLEGKGNFFEEAWLLREVGGFLWQNRDWSIFVWWGLLGYANFDCIFCYLWKSCYKKNNRGNNLRGYS